MARKSNWKKKKARTSKKKTTAGQQGGKTKTGGYGKGAAIGDVGWWKRYWITNALKNAEGHADQVYKKHSRTSGALTISTMGRYEAHNIAAEKKMKYLFGSRIPYSHLNAYGKHYQKNPVKNQRAQRFLTTKLYKELRTQEKGG